MVVEVGIEPTLASPPHAYQACAFPDGISTVDWQDAGGSNSARQDLESRLHPVRVL